MAIDAAIAAARTKDVPRRWQGQVTLPSSGRVVGINVPADLAVAEALDIVAFVTTRLPAVLQEANAAAPRILVPTGPAQRT